MQLLSRREYNLILRSLDNYNLYMMAVGNLTPLRADLMHYVMSWQQGFQYFKKTWIGM